MTLRSKLLRAWSGSGPPNGDALRFPSAPKIWPHNLMPQGTPAWFVAAINRTPQRFHIEVEGCRIHARGWGSRSLPPLVLVHDSGAHSGWWDHIAPYLSATHCVIAPDLSGHGDSETRSVYDLRTWAREVCATPAAIGASGQLTIVGHGLGGWVAESAAQCYGADLDSIVVIDSPLRGQGDSHPGLFEHRENTPARFRTRSEIVASFVPLRAQPAVLPYVAHYIASSSVCRTHSGWAWKFDPATFDTGLLDRPLTDDEVLENILAEIPCRVGFLRSEFGLVPPIMADQIRSILQLRGPFVELAGAGHHPMLDHPLALVAALRTLLECWSIT